MFVTAVEVVPLEPEPEPVVVEPQFERFKAKKTRTTPVKSFFVLICPLFLVIVNYPASRGGALRRGP
jgi:hypothetical protein